MDTQIVVAAIGAMSLVLVAVIERGRRAARDAQQVAEEARDYAKPTGNGFAARVTASLERIETELADHRDQQNLARAEHQELRAADRHQTEQLARVEALLRDHIDRKG